MAFRENGGSSTCIMEPTIELQDVSHYITKPDNARLPQSKSNLQLDETTSQRSQQEDDDPVESLPSPTTQAAVRLERWNTPRLNFWRTLAAFWSFVVMGSNDAAYGVCAEHNLSFGVEANEL